MTKELEWNDIDDDEREEICNWRNVAEENLTEEQKKMLTGFVAEDRFRWWTCPVAGCTNVNRVVNDLTEEEWRDLQGVRNSEHLGDLCEDHAAIYLDLKEYAND